MPEKERRSKWLKTKYKLSYEEYEKLFINQRGLCAICQVKISIEAKLNGHDTACVDHNHATLKVRGLLCNHCNRAIGLMKENIESMKQMIFYLENSN